MTKTLDTILLIDDSELEHTVMEYLLEEYDRPVKLLSAFDGQEALDLIDSLETPPDLIFLDINMPRMSGIEFLEHYSTRKPQRAVVVMLTSSDQQSDINQCKAFGFVKDYLLKPIELEEFAKLVETLDLPSA